MNLKKTIFTFVMMLMLLLSACSSENSTTSGDSSGDTPAAASQKITLAGGSAGGLWSSIGESIGETVKRTFPGTTFTYQPGQDGANIITVSSGQANFGLVSSPAAIWALEGSEPYNKKFEDIRAVAYLHAMPYNFLVSEKSGINSIEQIVEEKMPFVTSVNTKDGPLEITNRIVFEAYGTSYEEIEKNGGSIQFIAPTKVNDQIKDGKMHGATSPQPTPTSSILELSTTEPVKLLSLNDNAIKLLEEKVGAYPYTIPKDTYDFLTEDIQTAAIDLILFSSTNVSDETVYNVVKSIHENLDYLYSANKSFEGMTDETIANTGDVPLHPGAEKYYKEAGIIK